MGHVITASDGTKIFITDLLAPGDFSLESYHVAKLLGYSQVSSTRKQILTDWKKLFTADVDYVLSHDKKQLEVYEMAWHQAMPSTLKPISAERGRMFLRPSGLRKVLERTSKDTEVLEAALATFFEPKKKAPAPTPAPAPVAQTPDVDYQTRYDRKRGYEILETLLDHLKNLTDPGLKRLAVTSAELGLGRELHDIRALLDLEAPVPRAPYAEELHASSPVVVNNNLLVGNNKGEVVPVVKVRVHPTHNELAKLLDDDEPVVPAPDDDKVARDYLAARPITSTGPLFDNIPGVHHGLKQIGAKAGGYSAVQAGKAADLVASRMGHSHDDIRRKKLSFNDLPELPDNTSGKLRKMYRFNAQFSNHVIVELRSSAEFVPATHPVDLRPFGVGGDQLPNLSQGPFEEA